VKVSGKPRIVINHRVPGTVELKAGSAGEVVVDVEPRPTENVIWNVSQTGNVVAVDCHIRDIWDWPGHIFSGAPRTNLRVSVPAESDLDIRSRVDRVTVMGINGMLVVESAAGVISMQDCAGVVQVRNRAGQIELQNVKGTVWADNAAGHIAFSGSLSNGESMFRTRLGDIDLTLQGEHNLRVEAYATLGRVSVIPELVGSRYDGGTYVGRIGSETGRLVAETKAGTITIRH
jgi:DUF4097 and DUF4098 domain-containing protein YvlB